MVRVISCALSYGAACMGEVAVSLVVVLGAALLVLLAVFLGFFLFLLLAEAGFDEAGGASSSGTGAGAGAGAGAG